MDKQKLNDIGMIWDVMDSSWQEVLEELKSYRNTYGNLDIKAKYVSPTGFRLGSWINNMRFKVKKYGIEQALTDEQRKALEELGMIWKPRSTCKVCHSRRHTAWTVAIQPDQ